MTIQLETDDLPGAAAPVLSARLLARIQALNLDYLELLAAEHEAGETIGQLQHLPAKLHAPVATLSTAARRMLAALPYTLYSLGFEDERFWRANCERALSPASVHERYHMPTAGRLQAQVCEVVLLYAWHVATSNPLAARLIYAMSDATAQRLSAAPLWLIKRLASEHPELLMPRWPTNPGFWPDLVRFAAAEDTARFTTARLLGSQLIAAELEASRGGGMGMASPRLRANKAMVDGRKR